MFFEAAANLGGGLLAIPLATLGSQTSGVLATVGLGVPAAVVGRLGDLGLFSHAAAETVAKSIFEMSGKTLTGHWMDATGPFRHLYPKGVSVGWHRGLHGHHFISDALTALRTPDLSVVATQRKQLAGGVIRAGYEMRSEGIRITDAKLAIRAA
jgi:hypothetical protein